MKKLNQLISGYTSQLKQGYMDMSYFSLSTKLIKDKA